CGMKENGGQRFQSAGGSGSTGRSSDARRSGITATLDVQECAQIGGGTPARRPRRELSDGGRTTARAGLQPVRPDPAPLYEPKGQICFRLHKVATIHSSSLVRY